MTLPVWLISAREIINEAIAAQSTKQQQEVVSDAQAALDEHLDELTALAGAVKGRPRRGLVRTRCN